jgi:alkylation response protein AidB-like acyl-CoA dehydrogenase
MDFRYSAEQVDFRTSLRGFLTEAAPLPRVRAIAAAGGHDQRLWRRVCDELELPALHLPPEHGGVGGTLADAAIAFEEVGRALAPVPLAGSVFTIEALLRAGDEQQRRRLLPGLLSGERIGAFAATGPDGTVPSSATVRADLRGGRPVLHGECSPVLNGQVADLFVVAAVTGGTVTPFVVTVDTPGLTVEPLPSFDTTRPVARLAFEHTPAEALAGSEELDRVLDVARVLMAAEMLGGAEACLAMSVEYACSRRQFNRPIGSFQAVKHACAEMMIEIDATRVAVMFAAMSATDPDQLAITAPLVKAQAADTFALCAGSAIQVHGGIAFTWEHDIHLYYRRAKTTEALFGSSTHHRGLLADRAGL